MDEAIENGRHKADLSELSGNSELILKFAAALGRAIVDYAFERADNYNTRRKATESSVEEVKRRISKDALMNKEAFAKRVGISRATLDRMIAKGLVEHTRPSPFRIYFTEEQLRKYMAASATTLDVKRQRQKKDSRRVRIVAD